MAFVAGGKNFADPHFVGGPAKRRNSIECAAHAMIVSNRGGHQVGDGLAVPGDDKAFAPLNGIQKLRQSSLHFRGLNRPHESTGQNDWSNM